MSIYEKNLLYAKHLMFYNVEIICSLNQKSIKKKISFLTLKLWKLEILKKQNKTENVNIVVFCLLLALEQVIR